MAVFCTQFYTPSQIQFTFWILVLHKTDHFLSLSVIEMALSWNISTYTLLITWTIIGGNIVLLLLLICTQEQPQKANYYRFSSSFLLNQYIATVIYLCFIDIAKGSCKIRFCSCYYGAVRFHSWYSKTHHNTRPPILILIITRIFSYKRLLES